MRTHVAFTSTLLAALASPISLLAQAEIRGPEGPSPYEVVRGWHVPFAPPGYAFGGNSGLFAESPDRIFVLQRGETRLPDPVPPEFAGYAGSIGINVLNDTARREWHSCLYTLSGSGQVREMWSQWDRLICAGSDGPGPHRIRISPYDPERRVWVVQETFHQIYVFSNDGSRLLRTLGEKGVPGTDERHFARPQDVAFLPDGRFLVADGLDNHRVMIFDEDFDYLGEVGGRGDAPGTVCVQTFRPDHPSLVAAATHDYTGFMRAELERRFPGAARSLGEGGRLWLLWPKRTSGMQSDLGEAAVRAFGLDRGFVDYKIAAIDERWSGLCFARRR